MNKALPINQIPLVSTYPEYGILFSLLDLEDESVGGWVSTNFLHTYTYRDGFTVFRNHFYLVRQCPFLHCFIMPRDYILCNTNIHEIIKYCMANNNYLLLNLDRYYIKGTPQYHLYHMPHLTFIYGYSEMDGTVLVSDNLDNGKYTRTTYQMDDVENAFLNALPDGYKSDDEILLIKRIDCPRYYFDLKFLIKELHLYIHPETLNIEEYYRFESQCMYNINSLKYIVEIMENNPEEIDVRSFYLFYERSILMNYRINYLKKLEHLDSVEELLERNNGIADKYRIIINKMLKSKIQKNMNLASFTNMVNSIICEEILFTETLIFSLQSKLNDSEKMNKQ